MNVDILRSVQTIVTHKDCSDGIASALILGAALPEVRVVFAQYGDATYRDLPAEPGLLFCDITPPRERVREFVEAGAIVLDHHKKQEDVVRSFGDCGVFADEKLDPGVSGAVLAYREVYAPLAADAQLLEARRRDSRSHALIQNQAACHRIAQLVGVRDTWRRGDSSFGRASAISEALRFIPFERMRVQHLRALLNFLDSLGPVLVERQLSNAREAADKAVRTEVCGRRVAIIPSVALTSDACELLDADVLAGFAYVADEGGQNVRLVWSLRSRTGVDVSKIAARHGGGGHTAAAGFHVPDDGRSPYARVAELLAES